MLQLDWYHSTPLYVILGILCCETFMCLRLCIDGPYPLVSGHYSSLAHFSLPTEIDFSYVVMRKGLYTYQSHRISLGFHLELSVPIVHRHQ